MRRQRLLLTGLATILVLATLLPVLILLAAAGIGPSNASPAGIALAALAAWQLPDPGVLLAPENRRLWASLARTLLVAMSSSGAASILAMIGAYLWTRRRAAGSRRRARLLALTAYGLPSVFLALGFDHARLALGIPGAASLWLLHFLYILPMATILATAYAETQGLILDRAAALDGAGWAMRFRMVYLSGLWRGHLGVFVIGAFVSWGDIAFSRHLMPDRSRLLVDLYLLRYFDGDTTSPDYSAAAQFSLVFFLIATAFAFLVAGASRRGT